MTTAQRTSAYRLIAAKGQTVTLTSRTAGTYDPSLGTVDVTTATQSGIAVILPMSPYRKAVGNVVAGDETLILAGLDSSEAVLTAPKVDSLVTDSNGKVYTVISVDTLAPAGFPIIHECVIRASGVVAEPPLVVSVYQSSALATFRTALANRASNACNIAVIGDSWVAGYNTFTYGTRWVDLLAVNLQTAFPTSGATGVGGSTFQQAVHSSFSSDGLWGSLTAWTSVIGSGGTIGTGGIGQQAAILDVTGSGYRYTFTGTSFDLYFLGGIGVPSGIGSVSIDGGAATTINAQSYGNSAQAWNSGALSYGTHTIDVTLSSGTAFYLTGFMFYNADETAGIRTLNGGRGGALASYTNLFGTYFSDGALKVPPVDLCVMALTINDYVAQTALATFKSDTITSIAAARTSAANSSLPICLVGYNEPGDASPRTIPYASYIDKLREIADADPLVAVVDLQGYIPDCATSGTPDALGFWDTDRLHPTTYGHSYVAELVANALGQ